MLSGTRKSSEQCQTMKSEKCFRVDLTGTKEERLQEQKQQRKKQLGQSQRYSTPVNYIILTLFLF